MKLRRMTYHYILLSLHQTAVMYICVDMTVKELR
jgi:hypothetical protein